MKTRILQHSPATLKMLAEIAASRAERERVLSLIPEPKCDCGVGVDRPKCMWEMGGDCPRHEVYNQWEANCRALDARQKEAARPESERSHDCATL